MRTCLYGALPQMLTCMITFVKQNLSKTPHDELEQVFIRIESF